VKVVRVLSQLALLSVAAAALVGLTELYSGSARPPLPDPSTQAERRHRPSAPQISLFGEFLADGTVLAIYALAGRLIFRLRLSPAPRAKGQSISLDLHRERRTKFGVAHRFSEGNSINVTEI
jgi:hypothetical protein